MMGINATKAALLVIVSHLKSAAFKLCFCVRGGKQRLTRHPPNRQDLHKQNENFNQDLHTSDDELSGPSFQTCTGTLPVHGAIKSTRADSGEEGRGLIAAPMPVLEKGVSEVSRQSEDICSSVLPPPCLSAASFLALLSAALRPL